MTYIYRSASNLINLLGKLVEVGSPPPELDLDFYRSVHNDLFPLSDAELRDRYATIDSDNGRIASPAAHRGGMLATISQEFDILEIGPYTRPALRGPNVRYFDVMDAESLLERAKRDGMPTDDCPEITYVSPTADMSIVESDKFDVVFSSHCIEHQPDLIAHLHHVNRVLHSGGRYYIAVPDKRYCHDHYIDLSDYAEVIRAHEERRTVHTIRSVYRQQVLGTHNDPLRHWEGDPDDPDRTNRILASEEVINAFHQAGGTYIDVHAWQFIPHSFREIFQRLSDERRISFEVERVYGTVYGELEFMAVLRKAAQG